MILLTTYTSNLLCKNIFESGSSKMIEKKLLFWQRSENDDLKIELDSFIFMGF